MMRDLSRRDEGSLVLFTLLILFSGALLLFFAKTRGGIPRNAVNVNTASAESLASLFVIDSVRARMLIRARERVGGFRYAMEIGEVRLFSRQEAAALFERAESRKVDLEQASPAELERGLGISRSTANRVVSYREAEKLNSARALASIPVLQAEAVEPLRERLIAWWPGEVRARFGLTVLGLSVLFVLIPVVLRRRGIRPDPLLIPLVLMLCALGLLAQFTLRDPFRDAVVYAHHATGLFFGFGALLAGAALPSGMRRNLRRYVYLWALGAILLILLLFLFGSGPGGVKLSLWFFQPVEVVKLLLALFLAAYFADRGGLLADSLHRWKPPIRAIPAIPVPRREDFAPLAAMFGVALSLFVAVKDLGPALIVFGAFIALFYIATGRSGVVGLGLILIVVGAFAAYRLGIGVIPVRIDMWLAPWNNPHPNGMQLGQSYWALSSGGLWGTGLGLGMPGLLPRGRDDLVFSVLGEELGLAGSFTVLVLYCLLIARGLKAAMSAANEFDRMLAGGITSLFGCQAFLVLAGVTGLLPLSGITLPFLGYGNSALIVNLFAAGLLIGISHRAKAAESIEAPALLVRTVRRTVLAACGSLLLLIGVGRLAVLQLMRDDHTAGRTVRTPDSDGVRRAKVNPRLLAVERGIPRGSIYDRNEMALAVAKSSGIGRRYPYGEATAHLVGYLDPSIGGPVGMERDYHSRLRGFASYQELVKDFRNKDLPRWITFRKPRVGQHIHLTIDAGLQKKAFHVLRQRAAALRDRRNGRRKNRASMVVMDPTSGEVLIAASLPSFDPNTLTRRKWQAMVEDSAKEARLFDRARQGAYPPGSSLKVATAAAAMEAGIDPVFTCTHVAPRLRWRYGGRTYVRDKLSDDQGDRPHGRVAMPEAIEHSCNLYFAQLGIELGVDRLQAEFSDRFGLRYTKAGAAFARDLPLNAIGQGTMLASPMEMARIAASIAHDGEMMQPRFVKEIREPGGRVTYTGTPSILGRPMGEANSRRLREMMRSVVTGGTARGVFESLPVEVGGKTGTAETDEGDRLPHSWFIGFTPYSQPRFAFACIIENGGYGKRGAAPAVNDVLKEIFR